MIHVGVLSPVTGGTFFGEVLAGIVRHVAAHGGRVTLVQTLDAGLSGDDLMPAPDVGALVGVGHIDGFISIAQACDAAYLQRLRTLGKPVVTTSNDLPTVDAASVAGDNVGGMHAAVAHLVEHGHTRIGFVGSLAQTDMVERHDGYRRAMAAHDLPVDGLFFETSSHVEAGGADAAPAVLASGVSAVICTTDRVALGLIERLVAAGRRVPRDVAVIGFDNIQAGWHTAPPLATIDQELQEIGAGAAALLLAELAGEEVEHSRHTVPATLIPRGSCGCVGQENAATQRGNADARAFLQVLGDHLGLPLLDLDAPFTTGVVGLDRAAVSDVIESALARTYPTTPSPETLAGFTETASSLLGRASIGLAAAGLPGEDVLRHCRAQLTVQLSHLQAIAGLDRAERLSISLTEQYDVGMELLGRVGSDPADLRWLDTVSVRLGALGRWEGAPETGVLRIATYDPAGVVADAVPDVLTVTEFPPRALVEHTDPAEEEVTFVIPVKGSSGDHGMLALVGHVDTHSGTGRATYNHWAALLGVALQQQRLLETVRVSEERYAFAAQAANDGLWERSLRSGRLYLSARCRELLDVPDGVEPDAESLFDSVDPADLGVLRETLARAEATAGTAVEAEFRLRRRDGSVRWMLSRAVGIPGEDGRVVRTVGSLSDIDRRKGLEEQLRHAALYDPVTGLPNRRLFLDRLGWAVEQAHRGQGRFAVVFLDLDGFKLINDSLGHLMGDRLLQVVGERLRCDLRSVDTAARFGGDEFAVLLYGLKPDTVLAVVDRLQEKVAEPVLLGDHEVAVSASVGIATSETGYTSAEDVLRDADIAMYHAKDAERGTACVFDPVMHTRATTRLRAQSELRAALLSEQFVVHYQPVVALDGAALSQFEALVRWEHPDRGLLLPAEFLPIMAESGTIVVLGQWIIDTVCAQIATWRAAYPGPVAVSVNLSHREFWSDQLLVTVTAALSRHDVPPSALILEITESVIMSDPEAARQIMADLHATGVRMHIDDFGTGQSSLHALRAFPVDALKIDQSFIHQLTTDHQTGELVRIIVGMGRTLGLDVVAEGVETPEQADHLRTMGCDTAQGWLYAHALPGPTAGTLLGTVLHPKSGEAVLGGSG